MTVKYLLKLQLLLHMSYLIQYISVTDSYTYNDGLFCVILVICTCMALSHSAHY